MLVRALEGTKPGARPNPSLDLFSSSAFPLPSLLCDKSSILPSCRSHQICSLPPKTATLRPALPVHSFLRWPARRQCAKSTPHRQVDPQPPSKAAASPLRNQRPPLFEISFPAKHRPSPSLPSSLKMPSRPALPLVISFERTPLLSPTLPISSAPSSPLVREAPVPLAAKQATKQTTPSPSSSLSTRPATAAVKASKNVRRWTRDEIAKDVSRVRLDWVVLEDIRPGLGSGRRGGEGALREPFYPPIQSPKHLNITKMGTASCCP
jgi:hypothetical protein